MAKQEDIYVEIGKIGVKKTDLDVKAPALSAAITKAAADYFKKKSGYTTKKPSGKDAKGFHISGNVTTLAKETKGNKEIVKGVISFVLAQLPGNKIITAKLEGSARTAATKDVQGDAEAVLAGAAQGAMETAEKEIKARAK